MNLLVSAPFRLLGVRRAASNGSPHTPSSHPLWQLGGMMILSVLLACVPTRLLAQGGGPIIVSPQTLPNAVVGAGVYSQTITATGGTGTKSFQITNTPPPGILLASNGLLSGTPTTAGSYNFLVQINDSGGGSALWAYQLVVIGPPTVSSPSVTSVSATTAILGGTITFEGGVAVSARGVVYALTTTNSNPQLGGPGVTAVTAPAGSTSPFNANVSGLAQGTSYSFKAYATNSTGTGYSPPSTFTTSALTIFPTTFPSVIANTDYSQIVTISGGTAPYTFTVTSGTLPPGLTLNPTGELVGRPTTAGNYSFIIAGTDATGAVKTQAYFVVILPPVTIITTAVPDYGLNAPGYFYKIDATGGTGDKTFNIIDGGLPAGLSIDATGLITGTPISPGTYNFTVMATDTTGANATRTFTLVIGGAVTITTASLSPGTLNQTNYNQIIAASGGTGFKSLNIASGTLPPGLNLNGNGVLSGTPLAAGSYDFTINATDASGVSTSKSFTLVINPALVISTTTLPDSPVSLDYNQTIATTGGTGAKTFAVTVGTLPTGLTLSSLGVLSGTPNTAGTSNFTVTVTDAAGATALQAYTIVVGGAIAVTPATLTTPVINVAGYSATFSATGGTGAKTFSVTSGTLPTGLSLSSSGVLSGTATAAGTYNFTVTATDTAGVKADRTFTLVIAPPVMVAQTITFASLPNRLASEGPIALSATASSGLPVTLTVTGPATLSGTTLTLTGAPGVVTVTASQAGSGSFNPAANVVQSFTVSPADRLINLSSRVRIANDASRTLVTGFVIGGAQAKRVLVRGIGPGLAQFGVTGTVVNPRLQIFNSAGTVIAENDDWSGTDTSAAFTQVNAFPLPAGSRDAALVMTLQPGSYTMQITAGTETGIALAEVYDASANPGAENQRLVNISTRGMVESGDGVLIGGFVVSGVTPKKILIRGVGPGLAAFSVPGTLADPRLAIYSGANVVAQNDNWSVPTPINGQTAATAAELTAAGQSVGAFGLAPNSNDAAVLVTLAPGAYTAQVAGAGTTSGVALVEIYEVQ